MDPREPQGPSLIATGALPAKVQVYEVGPRDGLQNERAILSVAEKVEMIEALAASGETKIEVSSFVSPRWIPQLADADDLFASLKGRGLTGRFLALVPNRKGLDRALAAGLEEIAVFVSASETHSRRNLNKPISEAVQAAREVANGARAAGLRVRGYLSTVWGCPYEGPISLESVLSVVQQLCDMGVYQVSLGDTIGVGTPLQTARIVEAALRRVPAGALALHLHDTRGTALANTLVGLSLGVTAFDSSVGGLGGCPYAPGAAGNLATEDLVYMLQGMGVETGIDLPGLVRAGAKVQELVNRKLPGKYLQAALGERRGGASGERGKGGAQ